MSCRFIASHAQGYCDCFKPRDFAELLQKEQQSLMLLDTLRHLRWQRISPDDSPEGQAVRNAAASRPMAPELRAHETEAIELWPMWLRRSLQRPELPG